MPFLHISGISKQYHGSFSLNNINFTQDHLEKIAIAGETGSGKTTLLRMIAGLEQPGSGKIILEGEKVLGPEEQLLPGNKKIAYLSQHFELRNNYSVQELLDLYNKTSQEKVAEISSLCRISHLVQRRNTQLSGGERQRVALALLLVGEPRLLILDEPFSNLDAPHRNIIKQVIDDICEKQLITCILVSHDPEDLLAWADKILVLKEGRIIQQASPEQVYRQPVNEYCAALFGPFNSIDNKLAGALLREMYSGRRLFLRPEQLHLSKHKEGIAGSVQKVSFRGSYYAVEVAVSNQMLLVKTNNKQFAKGDTVYVSVNQP